MTCHAKQYSDTMVCAECNLVWDVNDPHPPRCGLVMNNGPILIAAFITLAAILWWLL